MDNNQFNQFKPAKPNGNKELFKWIGLGCSGFGFLLTFIFSIVTCSRAGVKFEQAIEEGEKIKVSLAIIGVIIGVLIAIAGVVLSILSIEKGSKIDKIVLVAIAVGAFAVVYAIFSNATICGYNCSLNNNKYMELYRGFSSGNYDFSDLY
ncbi:MAG: hypothetical protein IJA34_08340 [Lachnospiraceae bacterium]|nr:hypothetical protein [Lachnospiraceae bacterium]